MGDRGNEGVGQCTDYAYVCPRWLRRVVIARSRGWRSRNVEVMRYEDAPFSRPHVGVCPRTLETSEISDLRRPTSEPGRSGSQIPDTHIYEQSEAIAPGRPSVQTFSTRPTFVVLNKRSTVVLDAVCASTTAPGRLRQAPMPSGGAVGPDSSVPRHCTFQRRALALHERMRPSELRDMYTAPTYLAMRHSSPRRPRGAHARRRRSAASSLRAPPRYISR